MRPATSHSRAHLSALAALALWGSLAAMVLRLRSVPPFFLLGTSLIIGGLVGLRRHSFRALTPRLVLLGLWGLFAYHLCLFLGLRWAPPVEANLLNYLWPLLIVVLSPVFLTGVRLAARHLAGVVLGFAGAAWLVAGGLANFSLDGFGGYLLAVAAAVIWATYSLLTRRCGGFPTASVAVFCLLSGALALAGHVMLEPRYLPGWDEVPFLLVIGLGPLGASFYLWDYALKRGDPRTIGTLSYLTPLLSTLLIWLTGQGPLTGRTALAGVLIVSGALLGSWRSNEPSAAGAKAPASSPQA